jgi:hypothetical protein
MLRIEKDSDGCVTKLKLSGRIQSDQITSIRSEIGADSTSKILDPERRHVGGPRGGSIPDQLRKCRR